jgi:hypothetical protein
MYFPGKVVSKCSNSKCGAELEIPRKAIRHDGSHDGYCNECGMRVFGNLVQS